MTDTTARVSVDLERTIAPISPLLFGGFAEHMGRCIYEGIYDPASHLADAHGLRTDLLAALRELNFRVMRYPGGNFLSGYNWRDGVGPKAQRPRVRELAWHSIETNQFGTDEFMHFCEQINTLPMMAVNLGTAGLREAVDLLEYCNAPLGTVNADLRAANGHAAPYDVRYWCLGNEMDGAWQIGHLEAYEYARKAKETGRAMKMTDKTINLIACGSSATNMLTYPEWDRIVLEECYDDIEYLSLHYYANNYAQNTPDYLALPGQFETHLDTLASTVRYVKAKLRAKRDVYLSWDEWNVWYKDRTMDGQWSAAPHLIEEIYNLEDALVVAQWLSVFLRHTDVLKIACIAQIVNVIAPILTRRDALLKQSIFYPLMLFSRLAQGDALDLHVRAPQTSTTQYGDVPVLDASGSHDAASGRIALFLVNRSLDTALPVEIRAQSDGIERILAMHQVAGNDPKAANSFARPDVIGVTTLPGQPFDGRSTTITVPPLSFTAVEIG